jgi:hypothetical protein
LRMLPGHRTEFCLTRFARSAHQSAALLCSVDLPRFRSLAGFRLSLLIPALSLVYVDHPGTFR